MSEPMSDERIAIIVFEIGLDKGFENVQSAHIQVPVKLATELLKAKKKVTILTNPLRTGTSLPKELGSCEICYIADPRIRKTEAVMHSGFSKRISIFRIIKSLYQIYTYAKANNLSVIHVYNGGLGVGLYAAIIKTLLPKIKLIWSPSIVINDKAKFCLWFLSKIDSICVATEFMQDRYQSVGIETVLIKHGIVRTFKLEKRTKNRVTFWRDPCHENGADIAYSAFRELSKRFPNLKFTMLVRPHWSPVIPTNSKVGNLEIYEFPYKKPITLEKIISESLLVIFPFRKLSVNPQLAILETLDAGVPCLASNIESVGEYVESAMQVCGPDVELWVKKINSFLLKEFKTGTIYSPRNTSFNWDNYLSNYLQVYGS